ncbi:TetR/AcrR family transcriptional regulator [Streptacidiphilus carbonis]|uniref:TetR/AcrR family transcriptional regulator n=1 Tax=Streptacidiphilus carbonis TaxID=105422 RepID=UPI0005A84868|nr:TetR/AcrR family transcriptional regulator [Streptacidiphilus carbonis]
MSGNPALKDHIAAGILDAAAAVLAERGEAASMADIAAAAGVGRATLYRRFPNREALLQALARAAVQELDDRLAEAGLDTAPYPEALARLTRAFVATGSKYIAFMRSGHKPIEPAEVDRRLGEPLRELFRRGAADGSLREDLPPEVLLALFVGLIEAALVTATQGGLGVERASAAAISVFLDGTRDPRRRNH